MDRAEAYKQYQREQAYKQYQAEQGQKDSEIVDPTYGRRGKDLLEDYGQSIEQGAKRGAEFMLDVGNLPISLTERMGRGFSAWTDENPDTTFGSEFMRPSTIGQSTAAITGMDQPQKPMNIPRGENALIDATRDALRLGTEYAVTAPLGGPALKETMKAAPYVMGGAAFGGQVAGTDVGADIGSIAGGFAPLIKNVGTRLVQKGKRGVEAANNIAENMLRGDPVTLETASDADIRHAMEELYLNSYPDMPVTPESINKLVEDVRTAVKNGEKGTLAQLSGDRGLIEFERGFSEGRSALPNAKPNDRNLQTQFEQTQRPLQEQAVQPIEQTAPTGVAANAAAGPRERVNVLSQATKARAEEQAGKLVPEAKGALEQTRAAEQAAMQERNMAAMQAAAPEGATITMSGDQGMQQLKAYVNQGYRDAWSKAGRLEPETASDMQQFIKDQKDLVNDADEAVLNRIDDAIEKLADDGSPTQLHNLDVTIRRAMEDADPSTQNYLMDLLGELRATLRDAMPEDAQDLLMAMDQKYPDYLAVRRAQRSANTAGGEFTGQQLGTASRNVGGDRLNVDAPLNKEMQQMVAADQAAKEDIKAAERGVSQAEQQARVIRQQGTRQQKAVEASPAAKFGEYENPVEAASKVWKSKTPKKDLRQLVRSTRNNPQQREDLRRAFMEDIQNSITKDGALTQDGYNTFKQRKDVYLESGLFTQDELANIENGLAEAQKLFIYDGGKLAKLPPAERRLAEALSALAGAKVGAMAMGSPLIGASLGRRAATRFYHQMSIDRINRLANEIALNPEKFVEYADKLKQPSITQKEIDDVLNDMLESVVVAGGPKLENEE